MNIVIEYRNPTPSHCDVALFVNGALAGTITLRQSELVAFQDFFFFGQKQMDKVIARGDPGQFERNDE